MPKVVQACTEQMKQFHSQWNIHFLDSESVNDFIDPIPIRSDILNKMTLAHRSDLIRTQLLIKYGGVWADPTVYFVKPLDEWLPEVMDSGLFLFSRPGRDRIISNWFIAAKSGNPLLIKLYEELCDYWNNNDFRNLERLEKSKTEEWLNRIINRNLEWPRVWFSPMMIKLIKLYPYMVYHFKFYDLIRRNSECKKNWEKTPEISADGPHHLLRLGLLKPLRDEAKEWIDQKKSPLFKLTWKLDKEKIPEGTVLDYLIHSNLSS